MHIGEEIRKELKRQERTVTWLAKHIHCERQNIYNIFQRSTIDTGLLQRISVVLHHDFFALYSKKSADEPINDQ